MKVWWHYLDKLGPALQQELELKESWRAEHSRGPLPLERRDTSDLCSWELKWQIQRCRPLVAPQLSFSFRQSFGDRESHGGRQLLPPHRLEVAAGTVFRDPPANLWPFITVAGYVQMNKTSRFFLWQAHSRLFSEHSHKWWPIQWTGVRFLQHLGPFPGPVSGEDSREWSAEWWTMH